MKSKDWFGPAIKATPLHYCETVKEAIPYFAAGYIGDEAAHGVSSAIHSVESLSLLKAFLEHGANPNAGLPITSPLHTHTDAAFLSELLKFGADVNARDKFGRTPLHCCTNMDALKVMLYKGADLNVKDNDGELPGEDFPNGEEGDQMREYIEVFRSNSKNINGQSLSTS